MSNSGVSSEDELTPWVRMVAQRISQGTDGRWSCSRYKRRKSKYQKVGDIEWKSMPGTYETREELELAWNALKFSLALAQTGGGGRSRSPSPVMLAGLTRAHCARRTENFLAQCFRSPGVGVGLGGRDRAARCTRGWL